jgi:hypothetical protein
MFLVRMTVLVSRRRVVVSGRVLAYLKQIEPACARARAGAGLGDQRNSQYR